MFLYHKKLKNTEEAISNSVSKAFENLKNKNSEFKDTVKEVNYRDQKISFNIVVKKFENAYGKLQDKSGRKLKNDNNKNDIIKNLKILEIL